MRRFLPAPAMIAIALTLLGQISAPWPEKTKDEHPASSCTVTGRVVTRAEGAPLKSARVALVPEHWGSRPEMYATTSDRDGHFLLKDIAPGRYRFFATRVGFVDQHYQSEGTDSGPVLALEPGQRISDVLFRMIAAAVVAGRVTNEDGEAMTRVLVVAVRRPTEEEIIEEEGFSTSRKQKPRPVASAETDDRGQFRIFGLQPGEYYLRATESFEPDQNVPFVDEGFWVQQFLGSEYAPVYYPGVVQIDQAQVVSVKQGEEVQADILMQRVKTVDVAGRVMSRGGPAKNVLVDIEPSGDDFGTSRQGRTDDSGNFRLRGVTPGSHVIIAYQEIEDTLTGQARLKVEVDSENIESLTISLGGGASFHGHVTVAGPGSVTLEKIRVALSPVDEDEQLGGYGRVKKDGTFEITSVKDGNYTFSVWGLEQDWYVKSVRLGADDILETGLQLEGGGSGGKLEVVISSASARLEGFVTDQDNAVVGAHVRVVPDPQTPYNQFRSHSARTDQTGHFVLTGLSPGKYRAVARVSTSSSESGSLTTAPESVTLAEHDHKTIKLTMVKPQAE